MLSEAQRALLRRAVEDEVNGTTLQSEDVTVAGELARLDLVKHRWKFGGWNAIATPAGRSALTPEQGERDGHG